MSAIISSLPKRVLVVSKLTRFESVSKKFKGKRGTELLQELRARGIPHERIRTSHETHHEALGKLVDGLKRSWNSEVFIVSAPVLQTKHLADMDAVFTAGGDGTVLETALRVRDNKLPVITVNTDPVLSTGYLCAFKLRDTSCVVSGLLDKLRENQFSWIYRSRIQISIDNNEPLEELALNEIFFAEEDASRPTVHETTLTSLDGSIAGNYVQRSSGVIVCTGTGSTAWMSSASMVSKPDVERILKAGGLQNYNDSKLDEICKRVNGDCVYSPESRELQYFVREPVMNGWYGRHDEPLSATPRRGFVKEMKLRSLGWGDVTITLDGMSSYSIPYGEVVHVTTAPDDRSLKTVKLN